MQSQKEWAFKNVAIDRKVCLACFTSSEKQFATGVLLGRFLRL